MEKIYSKQDSELLAILVSFQDFNKPRNEIVPASEFIQGAAMRVNDGDRFRPHRHVFKEFESKYGGVKAQECWIVMKGVIKITIYDFDNTVVKTSLLREGDACFSLHGGHTFECVEDHTFIYEIKTGPYTGQANDKIFIDE